MKFGLVLEGGASRGIFSCGVLDSFLKNNIIADYVIGTSAGIANGVSYCSGQFERNKRIGINYYHDKRYMGFKHLLNPKTRSFYNVDFVFGEIPHKLDIFDYDAFAAFKGEIIACVTNIETGLPEYLDVPRTYGISKPLVASCSLPILFKPVQIDGKLYMDGGLIDSIPYQKAIDDGCDKVIVVLTRERDYVKTPESMQKLIGIMYKKYPKLLADIKNRHNQYNEARNKLFELEKQGKVYVITPDKIGEFSRIEKDPAKIEALYNQGFEIAQKQMDSIKKYLEIGE